MKSLIGQQVVGGQYRVLRALGTGGFGTVYEVETVVGQLRRAFKVLNERGAADADTRTRFINEAVAVEQINHPNIARCFAVGELSELGEGALYLLLELVDGEHLRDVLAEQGEGGELGRLEPRRVMRLGKQIASGLVAAHAQGVLHRDLKLENILLSNRGRQDEAVKVIDFGIAKLTDKERSSTTASLLGTPGFMAPEQLSPGTPLDGRLDLWQLGAVMYMMVTGEPPYAAPHPLALLGAMQDFEERTGRARRPSDCDPELARYAALDVLIGRMLSVDPDARPASAREVVRELARAEQVITGDQAQLSSLPLLDALCADPSERGWWTLCRFLLAHDDELDDLLPAAERHLRRWPDELRAAPCSWWEAQMDGESHPLWSLARSLDLSGQDLDDEQISGLAKVEAISSLTRLDLSNNVIGNAGLGVLCRSPHLKTLRSLDLGGNRLTSAGLTELGRDASLRQLDHLSLSRNAIGVEGVHALLDAPLALRSLELADNDLRREGIELLAGSERFSALERLDISHNATGPDAIAALSMSPHLRGLTHLDVTHNDIGASGLAALALTPHAEQMRALYLAQNNVGHQGFQFLLAARSYSNLELLDVASNGIGASGLMGLAASPFGRRLKRLELADNALGDAGFAALLGTPQASGLRSLGVAQNGLSAAGISLLRGASLRLEELDLSRNPVGRDEGLSDALAPLPLESLALSGCDLDGRRLAAVLAKSPRLRRLDISSNDLGRDGVKALVARRELTTLHSLDMAQTKLDPIALGTLLSTEQPLELRELALDSNRLGVEGIAQLTRAAPRLARLQRLWLSDTHLTPQAIGMLASSPLTGQLQSVDLSHNELADEGAQQIADAPSWHSLRHLKLQNNNISVGGALALLTSESLSMLSHLDLQHNALVSSSVDAYSLRQTQIELMESSFALLSAQGDQLAKTFYQRLFSRYPVVKPLFANVNMNMQRTHLLTSLVMIVDHLRDPELLEPKLRELGKRHDRYGVRPTYYYAVAESLLGAIREHAGEIWTEELETAWSTGLDAVINTMMTASIVTAKTARALPVTTSKGRHSAIIPGACDIPR